MQAQDVMVRGVISVGPDIPVQIAAQAMVSNGVSAVLVMDINAKLIGIVPLVTGLAGNCPVYSIFGWSTCQNRAT